MKKHGRRNRFFGIVLAAVLLSACAEKALPEAAETAAPSAAAEASAEAGEANCRAEAEKAEAQQAMGHFTVTLAAAESLRRSFEEEIIPAFEKAEPNLRIDAVFASSEELQEKIEAGLSADIFFSESIEQISALSRAGLVRAETLRPCLSDQLVIIVPEGNALRPSEPAELNSAGSIAAAKTSTSLGKYTEDVLLLSGLLEDAGEKLLWQESAEDVIEKVAAGEADCGIVYGTQAVHAAGTEITAEIGRCSMRIPVTLQAVRGKNGAADGNDPAEAFWEYIFSDEARDIFVSYGFFDSRILKPVT